MPRNGGGRYHRTPQVVEVFGAPDRAAGMVSIEVGRGGNVEVPVGGDFVDTIETVAREHHFGGFYRIFLNGNEIANPDDAPDKIEAGMRIAIASYDKVGSWKV